MRLRSVALAGTLAVTVLATSLPADAQQQAGRTARIGYLSVPSRQSVEHALQHFLQALGVHGWVEGKNLVIEWRWADGDVERLPAMAADLVRREVDLIVAPAMAAVVAAKRATSTIPIVMIFPADPVKSGLVASLARPGGNVTGTSLVPTLAIYGKQLELLKETVPRASRVAVLRNPGNPSHPLALTEVERAAQSLGVQLDVLAARGPEEIKGAFEAPGRTRAEALLVLGDATFLVHRALLADLAAARRLPTMHAFREHVEAGGLMAYGLNMSAFARRAAGYVDKILRGAKPADLPVEQPAEFELVINMRTAKALGLTIPPAVLLRADEVIE